MYPAAMGHVAICILACCLPAGSSYTHHNDLLVAAADDNWLVAQRVRRLCLAEKWLYIFLHCGKLCWVERELENIHSILGGAFKKINYLKNMFL